MEHRALEIPHRTDTPGTPGREPLFDSLEGDLGRPESLHWRTLDIDGTEITVPDDWSDTAARILHKKYMRKHGVPNRRKPDPASAYPEITDQKDLPSWLLPRKPDYTHKALTFSGEIHAGEVFHRIAGHWTYSAWVYGYIATETQAESFYRSAYMGLAKQVFAPNSPQWFNTGLWWAYGIQGASTGHHPLNADETLSMDGDGYRKPQTSACFILGVEDNLVEPGGIFDTLNREAQIFKYGSGAGGNFSKIRHKGAPLSSGGESSGLLSFLKVLDHAAGAIKSGGTTRRAAKMVVVNASHPDARAFAGVKAYEENKIRLLQSAAEDALAHGDITNHSPEKRAFLQSLVGDWETEAHDTVGFQNANHSIRFTDQDMAIVERDDTEPRNDHERHILNVWKEAVRAAHYCGDPGVQFDTTCNAWHTIPQAGRQNGTNPCSEFSFIDDTACNLASVNVMAFFEPTTGTFNTAAFERVCRFVTTVLDITVSMSSYPTEQIALNSYRYRPLGLGLTNIGTLLMCLGLSYASEAARNLAGSLAAMMQAAAWHQSSILADRLGAVHDYEKHRTAIAGVKERHKDNLTLLQIDSSTHPIARELADNADTLFNQCGQSGKVRNAQLSLMAPTGTISFIMDCDTTGIEPDFALAKTKKLAGGGELNTVNRAIPVALERMGYDETQRAEALYALENHGEDAFLSTLAAPDRPVFHTANRIDWRDHVRMMAAVQPFLSGAISKTVNMPADATPEDVSDAYMMAWKHGLKALAIYRDGCKTSQPMTSSTPQPTPDKPDTPADTPTTDTRSRLPANRRGTTVSAKIDGHRVYLRTGEYEDGQLGEVFLTIAKAGSALRTYVDALAVCVSIGLQYGVPPSQFIAALRHTKSEPSGMVADDPHIRFCSSVLDWAARTLERLSEHPEATEATESTESTGESCPDCGAYTIYPSGTCLACASCGWTGGCS